MMARPKNPFPDEKDRMVMQAILDYIEEHQVPPSIRDIQKRAQISSPSVVKAHLKRLAEAGHIEYLPEQARGIRVIRPLEEDLSEPVVYTMPRAVVHLPNYGPIAAGISLPRPGTEALGTEAIPLDLLPANKVDNLFVLEVKGTSMIDALVDDGDLVVLERITSTEANPGDMVAAWLPEREETTLKYYYPKRDQHGRVVEVILRPANPYMEDIVLRPNEVEIQGRVVMVLRRKVKRAQTPPTGKQAANRPKAA